MKAETRLQRISDQAHSRFLQDQSRGQRARWALYRSNGSKLTAVPNQATAGRSTLNLTKRDLICQLNNRTYYYVTSNGKGRQAAKTIARAQHDFYYLYETLGTGRTRDRQARAQFMEPRSRPLSLTLGERMNSIRSTPAVKELGIGALP